MRAGFWWRLSGGRPLNEILSAIDGEVQTRGSVDAVLSALDNCKQAIFDCLSQHFESTVVAKALTLKIQNLCLAKCHFLSRSITLLSGPLGLVVDPADGCNLACPGCVHSRHAKEQKLFIWDNVMLSEDRLTALLKRYGPYAIHTTFYNYGEPLLNPNTPKFIRLAKKYLMGTTLSTNLSLGRFNAEAYVDSGLDFMVLSIDGATQPVYEKFRRQGNLELVYRNIRTLVEAKRRLGKRTPVISWQYLAFQHNEQDIPLAIETARRLGVNQLTIATPYDVSWDDPGIQPARVAPVTLEFDPDNEDVLNGNWNPFPAGLEASTVEREFDALWVLRAQGIPESHARIASSTSTCHWLYKNMVMDGGGKILPCCAAPRPDIDLVYSNSDDNTASDPFNSEKYRLARLSFADRKAYEREGRGSLERDPHCANCDWFEDQANAITDRPQIRQYLKAAGVSRFDAASLEILSSW